MVSKIIPVQLLFSASYGCPYVGKIPASTGSPAPLEQPHQLVYLGVLDGLTPIGEIFVGWNEYGFGLAWQVRDKQERVYSEPNRPAASDGLTIWIDTRGDRTSRRGTRFCHQYVITPVSDVPGQASVSLVPISRSQEQPIVGEPTTIKSAVFRHDSIWTPVATNQSLRSYRVEVFFPRTMLMGFDPGDSPTWGFCYRLRDREKGDQLSAAGQEFPYWEDPSLWADLELKPKAGATL